METQPTPVRLRLSRKKGFRLVSPNGLSIVKTDRTTKWGNPFRVLHCGSPAQAVQLFREWLISQGDEAGDFIVDIKRELKGKNLACWCPLFDENGLIKPCHADELLRIANTDEEGAL